MNRTIAFAAISILTLAISASAQNNAEQVTFSATGATMNLSNNSKATSTPFGFWLWCSAEAPPNSKGVYAANFACNGSMYFYGLAKNAMSIVGFVTEDPQHPGIYTMTVFQGTLPQLLNNKLDPAFSCTLTNTTPDAQGPVNSLVDVGCQFAPSLGGGTGLANGVAAGVNVTGPK